MNDWELEAEEPAGFSTESIQVAPQSYLGVFTVESWREFKRHGGAVMGFNDKKAGIAGRLAVVDRILCYLSKESAFVGWMEVTGKSYRDETPLWTDGLYPVRLPVRVCVELPLANAVAIKSLADRLSFMKGRAVLGGWSIYVRSSPRRWLASDAAAVIAEVEARLLLRAGHAAGRATQRARKTEFQGRFAGDAGDQEVGASGQGGRRTGHRLLRQGAVVQQGHPSSVWVTLMSQAQTPSGSATVNCRSSRLGAICGSWRPALPQRSVARCGGKRGGKRQRFPEFDTSKEKQPRSRSA